MSNNALVLQWKGEILSDYLIQKIAELLTVNRVTIPEMLTIKYVDEESIAKILIRDAAQSTVVVKNTSDDEEAIKNAVIYIGERFKESLSSANKHGDALMFAIELLDAAIVAKRSISFTGVRSDNELLAAIKILSKTTGVIPSALAKKYHFSQKIVDVIKEVHNKIL